MKVELVSGVTPVLISLHFFLNFLPSGTERQRRGKAKTITERGGYQRQTVAKFEAPREHGRRRRKVKDEPNRA